MDQADTVAVAAQRVERLTNSAFDFSLIIWPVVGRERTAASLQDEAFWWLGSPVYHDR